MQTLRTRLHPWRGDFPYQESSEQQHDGGAAFRNRMQKRAQRAAKATLRTKGRK